MTGKTRTETDSFGPIEVPADAYWGAQTQRSIANFPFPAHERMPMGILHALALVKQAASRVNRKYGLDAELADAIEAAATRARSRNLLLRQTKGDAGFGRCGACSDEILLRRDALRKQTLFAGEIAVRQRQPCASSFGLGVERGGLAALDHGKRLAKRDDARAIAKYRAEGATPQDIRQMVGL